MGDDLATIPQLVFGTHWLAIKPIPPTAIRKLLVLSKSICAALGTPEHRGIKWVPSAQSDRGGASKMASNGHGSLNGHVPNPRETTISAVAMHCSHDPAANWKKYEAF